jgi:O-methyltransferase involved in polyketide biosynthesis
MTCRGLQAHMMVNVALLLLIIAGCLRYVAASASSSTISTTAKPRNQSRASSFVYEPPQQLSAPECPQAQHDSSENGGSKNVIGSAALGYRAALLVGVQPQTMGPRWMKRLAWKLEKILMNVMSAMSRPNLPDSKLSLRVLWWKALAANNSTSPVHDQFLTYDMLPAGFRLLISPWLVRWYPRWVHVTIETRTAYLDQAVLRIIASVRSNKEKNNNVIKIRLITMGGGYDVRSLKFRQRGLVDQAIELDLEQVIQAKSRILTSRQFRRRRPNFANNSTVLPTFFPVDLNQLDQVRSVLLEILTLTNAVTTTTSAATTASDDRSYVAQEPDPKESWHNIFLWEGVLMYLNDGVPHQLLQLCRQVLDTVNSNYRIGQPPSTSKTARMQTGSLCFADDLDIGDTDDLERAQDIFHRLGWKIVDWLPKGSRTRHMGIAEMLY